MGKLKNNDFKSDIIRASEIGQFYFCSIAWYLKKYGYKPISPFIDIGINKHFEHGKIVDYSNSNLEKSKILLKVGFIFLIIAFFIFLYKVIL